MANCILNNRKLQLWKIVGVMIAIMGFFFAIFCAASEEVVVYESDLVSWVVLDKHKVRTLIGGAPGPVNYIVEIKHSEDSSCTTKVNLGHLSLEEWDAISIGDTCYYPKEIITFWDYYILGKRPGPEDGFQISGRYPERLQWEQ